MTSWTTAYQAPPSTGLYRQEYWSGVPLPSPMTSLDSMLKSTDTTLLIKVYLAKATVLSVVIYGCESWTVKKAERLLASVQFSSVTQSCPTLCNPMNCSTPGLPVHHHLLELTQTHVHQARDAIQPSHPRSSPSPPAPNTSQHQSLCQ